MTTRRRHYGDTGTIHQSGEVNVELDRRGRVVSVWFRCALLPFTATYVDSVRAVEMSKAYRRNLPRIAAIDFIEEIP